MEHKKTTRQILQEQKSRDSKIIDVGKTKNNARIKTLGAYWPVKDIEPVDKEQKVWKGKRINEIGLPEGVLDWVFFSRDYKPEVNEYDQIIREIEFTDESILGYPFWLIPKEKLFFGYDPPSILAKPDLRPTNSNPLRRM